MTVGTDADGNVTIDIKPKPENDNGNGLADGARRGFFGRVADKMAVASNSDGSITVRPEGDAVLQIVSDPLSGAITVVEIIPSR